MNSIRRLVSSNQIFVKMVAPFTSLILFLQNISSYHKSKKKYRTWKKKNPDTLFKTKEKLIFKIFKDVSSLSRVLLDFENYEIKETKLVKKIIKNDMTVIDAGANFGWYSLNFAKLIGNNSKSKIYSFEPIPKVYKELNLNIKLNQYKNIKTFNYALGSKNSNVKLGTPYFSFIGSSGATSEFLNFSKKINCKMFKIDTIVKLKKIKKIDFIKADIEGGELNLLKGAEKTLLSHKPKIFIEIVDIHCARFGHTQHDVIKFLIDRNYKGFFINNRLSKINLKKPQNGNYLFVK